MKDEALVEVDEIDRTPPITLFLSGESFLKSAQHLRGAVAKEELKLKFSMPIYYLYSHALELTLKAFLRCKGFSIRKLASRDYGHKLQKLWDTCIENDLKVHDVPKAFISEMVELLDPYAVDYEFRYVKTGMKILPALDAVESAVLDLMEIVRPHCAASVKTLISEQ